MPLAIPESLEVCLAGVSHIATMQMLGGFVGHGMDGHDGDVSKLTEIVFQLLVHRFVENQQQHAAVWPAPAPFPQQRALLAGA